MRRIVPLSLLLVLAACSGPRAQLPEGITVVEAREPPPPPAAVEQAQRSLQALELYAGPVDGDLTPAVRVAIARFQRQKELPVSGDLDGPTAEALGIGGLAASPEAPGGEADASGREAPAEPEGPRAADILSLDEAPPLPQPPPGALEEARSAASRLLAAGTARAGEEVARTESLLQGAAVARADPPETSAAAGGEVRAALGDDLLGAEQAADRAACALLDARREAFDLILEARRAGGWSLLPPRLLQALEAALLDRALLLRGRDGRIGPDDEAAIRWIQRSLGQEATGIPSLDLLEALGIDPSPMFDLPAAGH